MYKARSLGSFVLGVVAGVLLAALVVPLATGHRAIADESAAKGGASKATAENDRSNKAAWNELRKQMDRQDARRAAARHRHFAGARGRDHRRASHWSRHGRGYGPAWSQHGHRGPHGWGPPRGPYWAQHHHHHGPVWAQHGYRGGPPGWAHFRGPYWAGQHRPGSWPNWAQFDRNRGRPPHEARGTGGFWIAQRGQPSRGPMQGPWPQGGGRGQPGSPREGQLPTGMNVMRRLDQLEQKLDSLFREVSALRGEPKQSDSKQ